GDLETFGRERGGVRRPSPSADLRSGARRGQETLAERGQGSLAERGQGSLAECSRDTLAERAAIPLIPA
ncbi:MAG: hypothetical protein COY42_09555, partial [Armatimonadetes bacterium CG_4_10_14_0_8_um_filter_66_14]